MVCPEGHTRQSPVTVTAGAMWVTATLAASQEGKSSATGVATKQPRLSQEALGESQT